MSLVEWFADNYTKFGTQLEFVTNRSQEGNQFCKGFGGVGGLLRWKVSCVRFGWIGLWAGDEVSWLVCVVVGLAFHSTSLQLFDFFAMRPTAQVDFAEHNEDNYGEWEDGDDDDDHDEADYDDPF